MAELRHLKIYNAVISESNYSRGNFVQEKLQTISAIRNPSREFLDRIPNIRNLRISMHWAHFDLYHLHKLETLRFSSSSSTWRSPFSSSRFPPLRELSITDCRIYGSNMADLCEIPNLEVVKLQGCNIEAEEWDATQQVFCRLQFLLLDRLQLVHWEADETNFPRLRRLVTRRCYALEEIPSAIGELPTLQTIELDKCSTSLVASAQLIIEEQRELENYDLQLRTDRIRQS